MKFAAGSSIYSRTSSFRGIKVVESLSCPHCGSAVLNDPNLAGQVVACPSCQKHFRMPGTPVEGGQFQFEGGKAPPAPPPPPPSPQQKKRANPPPSTPARQQKITQPNLPASPPPQVEPEEVSPSKGFMNNLFRGEEPWYYLFLDRYAKLILWIGLAFLGLMLLVSFGAFIVSIFSSGGNLLYIGAALLTLLLSVILLAIGGLGLFYFVSLILLLLDSARNLRAIRRNTEKKT